MRREDVERFLRRDWQLLADSKEDFWAARLRELGPGEGIRVADELRREMMERVPDWPSPDERAADLAHHQRVAEILRRVTRSARR